MFHHLQMNILTVKEFETLFEELFETKKDDAMEIMNFVYKLPHDYLFLNVDSQRMFKNFDEILIQKDIEN